MNPSPLSPDLIGSITDRLRANQPVRRRLPGLGRIHIDRQLPFLCVYRRPENRDDPGTERLITGEASHLLLTEPIAKPVSIAPLVDAAIQVLSKEFGAFLLMEVWTSPPGSTPAADPHRPRPRFVIHTLRTQNITSTLEVLQAHLEKITVQRLVADVKVSHSRKLPPPDLPPILSAQEAKELHCHRIALEVAPIYQDAESGTLYPLLLRRLSRGVSRALKRTFHHFSRNHTSHTPPSYMALGRRSVGKAVWEVDDQLAAISDSFDFLLQVTPVNIEASWSRFRRWGFDRLPQFIYRPRPIDPALVKRRLFKIPIERVEDPTLEQLFREKQEELDCQLSMLMNRDTRRFLYGSLQLYGDLDAELVQTANRILSGLPPRGNEVSRGTLNAQQFAERARREVAHYRKKSGDFKTSVQVRDDIYSGLMVSSGNLLIGKNTRVPPHRVEALLNHEIGTHSLTYHNGRAQPFHQLHVGLAGYEELQEGLAVLAEYLVGGLTTPRLRLLAARVVTAHALVEGATFADAFKLLHEEHGFSQRTSFTVAMRIFRGGGLTKDAVYLRGLLRLLSHLRQGKDIEPLYIGKIAAHHLPLISELRWRRVLKAPPILPRFLDRPECRAKIERLRTVTDILQLTQSAPKRERKP